MVETVDDGGEIFHLGLERAWEEILDGPGGKSHVKHYLDAHEPRESTQEAASILALLVGRPFGEQLTGPVER